MTGFVWARHMHQLRTESGTKTQAPATLSHNVRTTHPHHATQDLFAMT